jgi:hypothetical protein
MQLKPVMRGAAKGIFLLFLILPIACLGIQKTVKPEDRIALLEGGPHSGNYESQPISLDYQYAKQSDGIRLSVGTKVETRARYAGLEVWVQFVDSQGKILEEKSIHSGENTFKIPPGTTDLAFRTFLEPVKYKPPMSR